MTNPFRPTRIATALAGVALALTAGQVLGAAFALQENSGSGLGNAYAGGAAAAEDAATLWSNVAGMSRIGTNQVAGAINIINPSAKFNNNGSVAALNQPLGGNGGDAGNLAFVPNLYVVIPINRQWSFGLGVNAPFGLVTEYDNGWLGRYQALKSDVKTLNINPAVSWKITDNVAIGAGGNYQQIKATFTNSVNYSAGLASAAGTAAAAGLIPAAAVPAIIGATGGLDSSAEVKGDDYSWGWNVGILIDFDKNTRVGAQYRSSIKYNLAGNVSFCNPAAAGTTSTCGGAVLPTLPPTLAPVVASLAAAVNAQLANGGITSNIELPSITNISFFSRLNDRWDVMGDAQWTQWSSIPVLKFVRTTGTVLSSAPENFKDAWRFALGANYHIDDKWMVRGGYAYDQTPVNTTDMTPRLPDGNRNWLTLGGQYKYSKSLALDVGVAYVWINDPEINQNAGSTAANGLIKGNYSSNVGILSGQMTYSW
ncbi:MAG: outer membrane protein transport protein [Betaproteobacteria bacterium]